MPTAIFLRFFLANMSGMLLIFTICFFFRKAHTFSQATKYIAKSFEATESSCGKLPKVTILQRLSRTIANVEEIKEYLLSEGIVQNVEYYVFEKLSIKEQVQFSTIF